MHAQYRSLQLNYMNLVGFSITAALLNSKVGREVIP